MTSVPIIWPVFLIPVLIIIQVLISNGINKKATAKLISADTIAVCAGMLTALAILIPLGVSLLPEGPFTPRHWAIVGALIGCLVCILLTAYAMYKLTRQKEYQPSDSLIIPNSMNATWLALVGITFTLVIAKVLPAASQAPHKTNGSVAQARFSVVRDLPRLKTHREAITAAWGSPVREAHSSLLYQTNDGFVIFCLDSNGSIESITENAEADINAVSIQCRSN